MLQVASWMFLGNQHTGRSLSCLIPLPYIRIHITTIPLKFGFLSKGQSNIFRVLWYLHIPCFGLSYFFHWVWVRFLVVGRVRISVCHRMLWSGAKWLEKAMRTIWLSLKANHSEKSSRTSFTFTHFLKLWLSSKYFPNNLSCYTTSHCSLLLIKTSSKSGFIDRQDRSKSSHFTS